MLHTDAVVLDGLFAFHTSAEDAEYLAEELGGGLNKQDLLELGYYQCYVRITDARNGERLPAFTVRLDAPPMGDSSLAERLAHASAERYGRPVLDVELDLEAAAERIRGAKLSHQPEEPSQLDGGPKAGGGGGTSPVRSTSGGEVPRRSQARSHRKGTGARRRGRDGSVDDAHDSERGEAPAA